jgi:thymidylate synthase
MRNKFYNANEAFNYYWFEIQKKGIGFDNTKALFNIGFEIQQPIDNSINAPWRNWNKEYAEAEWQWYLSGSPKVSTLGSIYGKIPTIWQQMADDKGEVRSNYGWQWQRNNQIDKIVELLKEQPNTRKASISIYDAKEFDTYGSDTPCTYAVNFTMLHNKLNMSVVMRSNDLWFGFCNDQYCFSMLQKMIAETLSVDIGMYYHFAQNFHIYNKQIEDYG